MTRAGKLFTPCFIASLELKNRVAMAPMATDFADGEGLVSDRLISYYEARARGGVGLIIAEVCSIDERFPYVPRNLGLWDDSLLEGLGKLTKAIHAHGAKVIPQLAHPGPESLSPIFSGIETVGPSAGIRNSITRMPCRELSKKEIREIVDQFGRAALRARNAGFDGIELHAAHSYMLAGSFLSALRNRRTDEYGGSLESRMRFCLEVIESIKDRAGRDFPLVMRISGDELVAGGRTIRETLYMLPALVEAGVDAFHVSAGVYPDMSWRVIPPAGTPFAINTEYSKKIKESVDVPVMVVGRITTPGMAEDILQRGEADMVVLGRALLADPDFAIKAKEGRDDDIAPCIGCGLGCVTAREKGGDMTCVVNPGVGMEKEHRVMPAGTAKTVMVIGGGPAGLTAAAVAAERGHSVSLYEKDDRLGGQLNLAAMAPSKSEMTGLIKHLIRRAQKAGVMFAMGTTVTPDMIKESNSDAVVVATGSRTCGLAADAADAVDICCSREVLQGCTDIDEGRVLIIGGGMVGCEVAEYLAATGDNISVGKRDVTIVEMNGSLGEDMFSEARVLMMARLREKNVSIYTDSKVTACFKDGVVIAKNGASIELGGYDYIINATGAEPVDDLAAGAEGITNELYVIGDASEPRQALQAITEGDEVGRTL